MNELVKLSAARRAVAEAKSVNELKNIRNQAEAIRYAAIQAGMNVEIINDAAEMKLYAERRAGGMLAELEKRDGGHASKARSQPATELPPTLEELGITKDESSNWQAIASLAQEVYDDAIEKLKAANKRLTTAGMVKLAKKKKRTEARAVIAAAGAAVPTSDKWHVYHGDIATWQAPRQYDFIITDPPYKKEFVPLYSTLAKQSAEWLKPGGLLVAMSAHYYLNELYGRLDEHLTYFWTAAYLVPGETGAVFQKHINPQWKPILIYQKPGERSARAFADVFRSDANDKSMHKWGQSESGMYDIVSNLCLPGQYILDPFCGAGTTGVAALAHGCLFDGLELEADNVNLSRGRLAEAAQ